MCKVDTMKSIPGYPGYFATEDGEIVSRMPWHNKIEDRVLRGSVTGGYRKVSLFRDGKAEVKYVHHLVMLTWNGPTPNGMMILHGERGGLDNSLANLSFGTAKKNQGEDRLRDGTLPCGEKHGRAKLSKRDVEFIRMNEDMSLRELSQNFGVSTKAIYDVLHCVTWKYV